MLYSRKFLITLLTSLAGVALGRQAACTSQSFEKPDLFGAEILKVTAEEVHGFEDWSVAGYPNILYEQKPLDFCNVTVTYTHPGWGDEINAYVWLPLENWNGKYLGQGGGGWAAGAWGALAAPTARGFASAQTDAGHSIASSFGLKSIDAESWVLSSPGNVDWVLLQNFASRAYDDLAHIAKAVVKGFYRKPPAYSYWNGCSTGGRQGLMLAQRFPNNYDGILAAAPAINWATLLVAAFWPQLAMKLEGYYPPVCELEAIRQAAIAACDELDGVKDGVVGAPGLCDFDAQTITGQNFDCDGDERQISKGAATVANKIWQGPMKDGKLVWSGLRHEAVLASSVGLGGLGRTLCDEKNLNCKMGGITFAVDWIRFFLKQDPDYDLSEMDEQEFWELLHISRQQYGSIVGTNDPDLSGLKAAGGKLLMWHGLADEIIFPNGSSNYYERVLALDPNAADYYRYFEAPGVGHCAGGPGAYPFKVFDSLVDWVEKGKAPNHLEASTIPIKPGQGVRHRPLCPYPLVAAYKGGHPDEASSFECADHFGTLKASSYIDHSEL